MKKENRILLAFSVSLLSVLIGCGKTPIKPSESIDSSSSTSTTSVESSISSNFFSEEKISSESISSESSIESSKSESSIESSESVSLSEQHVHEFSNWEIYISPTYTKSGKARRTCLTCGEVQEKLLPNLNNSSFWKETNKVEPTSTEKGSATYKSDYGEVTIELEPNYIFSDWEVVVMPTEETEGSAKRTAQGTDYEETMVLPVISEKNGYKNIVVNPTNPYETGYIGYEYEGDDGIVSIKKANRFLLSPEVNHSFAYYDSSLLCPFIATNSHDFISGNTGTENESSYGRINFNVGGTLSFEYEVKSSKFASADLTYYYNTDNANISKKYLDKLNGEQNGKITIDIVENQTSHLQFDFQKEAGDLEDYFVIKNVYFDANIEETSSVLTFNSKGGTSIDEKKVITNSYIELPNEPTKNNCYFDGWYLDNACTIPFDAEKGISEDTTVYAKWLMECILSFNTNGGNTIPYIGVKPNSEITLPNNPVKEGYYFNGWFTDVGCKTPFDAKNGISKDTKIYAGWRSPITISFNTVGGKGTVDAIKTDINVAIEEPTTIITKDGYRFDGWFIDTTCETPFDFESGATESIELYAKWVEQVNVKIYSGDNLIVDRNIDKGDKPNLQMFNPDDFELTIYGYYVDKDLENEWLNESEINENIVLYALTDRLTTKFADEGVVSSASNKYYEIDDEDSSIKNVYPWAISQDGILTSSNTKIPSSKSEITFVLAKESVISFDYTVSSEQSYDNFKVIVNDVVAFSISGKNTDDGVIDATGSFYLQLNANDKVQLVYSKDHTRDGGTDTVTLNNLQFTNGIPNVEVTYIYNDGITATTKGETPLAGTLSSSILEMPENVRNEEQFEFDNWYLDPECTIVATSGTFAYSDVVLYAHWFEYVEVEFVTPDDASKVEKTSVWTCHGFEVEKPTKEDYVFKGWYLEDTFETLVDIKNNGVISGCTLYAYFEEMPVGSSKKKADEIIIDSETGICSKIGLTTTSDYIYYYLKLTPTKNDLFALSFTNKVLTGGNSSSTNYARFRIEDEDGNEILGLTELSDMKQINLEGGKTYYIIYTLSDYDYKESSWSTNIARYTGWGTLDFKVINYPGDTVEEAFDYEIGDDLDIVPNTFVSKYQKIVYRFEVDNTGDYKFSFGSDGWAECKIFDDDKLSNQVAEIHGYNFNDNSSIYLENGKVYYAVFGNNWTSSEIATLSMFFSIKNFDKGYTSANPENYTIGVEQATDFSKGYTQWYRFDVEEANAYALLANSESKTGIIIEIYNKNNLTDPIVSISTNTSNSSNSYDDQYDENYGDYDDDYYEEYALLASEGEEVEPLTVDNAHVDYCYLTAGQYLIKATYVSKDTTSYRFVVRNAFDAECVYKPTAITLPNENESITEITTGSVKGSYYSFTTGTEEKFHFFTGSYDTTLSIIDEKYNVVVTGKAGIYAKLSANTTYVLSVKTNIDGQETIKYKSAVEYHDGLTFDSAYVIDSITSPVNLNYDNSTYNVVHDYYTFTASSTGTYIIYSISDGEVDPSAVIYNSNKEAIGETQNDGYDLTKNLGGRNYDFYSTVDLVAGEQYYIYVEYACRIGDSTKNITLNFSK